ncbi:DsbA family protein [Mesorhizobium sp. M7A.F.Ca.US.008.03.1.1]|uniref:DsbA family protein n=1 Tax=Mesorhizobium sp. M7A.F.Ca.US.008.03.1.1 TaxID=2496742 RepID=UPI000FCA427E|nr:DsbA family protein [Mesorhizobium sp. M7A.F.Ca.US.008.03.1.1]RUW60707.1 DsbA family protein [Mesorhizobium sp. M7A.F.Ca.US.008.03.1.1]
MITKAKPLSRYKSRVARALLLAAMTGWLLVGLQGALRPAVAADETSQDQLDQRIHDYILAHPEVIMEALQKLDAQQRETEAAAGKATLAARGDDLFRDKKSPVGGNAEGNVTMVEFFDYNCPYCSQVMPVMEQAVADDPQLKIVYKEFPILGPDSVFAAKAALAAERQGKYAAFHKALFSTRTRVTESVVLRVAAETGLDVTRMKTDMQQADIQGLIDRNIELAQALRITGTPGFVVGEQIFPGATDLATMKKLIEQARALQK